MKTGYKVVYDTGTRMYECPDCKCHRCGRYLMHDGAITGGTVTMSEAEALQTKKEFEEEMKLFRLGREIARNVTAD